MIRIILTYSIILYILLIIIIFAVKIDFGIDKSLLNASGFIITGTMMMFGLNKYLKNKRDNQAYTYSTGFIICLLIAVIARVLFLTTIINIDLFVIKETNANLFSHLFLKSLPLNILLAIFIPLTFKSKPNWSSYNRLIGLNNHV